MTKLDAVTVNPRSVPLMYSFRRCPYAIRARMALHCAGVPFVLEEVALRQKPPGLLAASPKATVPVLVLPNGEVVDQSLEVMYWALRQHDPEGWLHPDTSHWVTLCDDTFKPLLDCYKYASRHPEQTPHVHRHHALEALILPMEVQLGKTPWLLGARRTLADVALLAFVRQFAGVETAWFAAQPLPAVQAWLAAWLASPWFVAAMQKSTSPSLPLNCHHEHLPTPR